MPEAADQFVRSTWRVIDRGEAFELAAVFAFGRESLIPAMFAHVLEGEHCVPLLRDYLIRHVELDEEVHTPWRCAWWRPCAATTRPAGPRPESRRSTPMEARTRMWDGILAPASEDDDLAVV